MKTFSQAAMNAKYAIPLMSTNVPATASILVRLFRLTRTDSRNSRIHIAQGLKPSTSPIRNVNAGIPSSLTRNCPNTGTSIMSESLTTGGARSLESCESLSDPSGAGGKPPPGAGPGGIAPPPGIGESGGPKGGGEDCATRRPIGIPLRSSETDIRNSLETAGSWIERGMLARLACVLLDSGFAVFFFFGFGGVQGIVQYLKVDSRFLPVIRSLR